MLNRRKFRMFAPVFWAKYNLITDS